MDAFAQSIADWFAWLQAIYYTIDRLWLGGGIVVSTLLGVFASRYLEQSGVLWRLLVGGIVGIGIFVALLALSQVSPVLFDAQDLARSQVSI